MEWQQALGMEVPPADVPIENLDFDYISGCTDAQELRAILAHLKSGKDGIFPPLEQHTQKRLAAIGGGGKAAGGGGTSGGAKQQAPGADTMSAAARDVEAWLRSYQAQAAGAAAAAGTGGSQRDLQRNAPPLPPPRKRAEVGVSNWGADAGDGGGGSRSSSSGGTESAADAAARDKAAGNDCFKRGDWDGAVAAYTASLRADGASPAAAVVLSNRAQARLKQHQRDGGAEALRAAVDDCTAAIALDGGYVKAWVRRGTARLRLGGAEAAREAVADLEYAAAKLAAGDASAATAAPAAAVAEVQKLLSEARAAVAAAAATTAAAPAAVTTAAPHAAATAAPSQRPEQPQAPAPAPADSAAPAKPRRRMVIAETSGDGGGGEDGISSKAAAAGAGGVPAADAAPAPAPVATPTSPTSSSTTAAPPATEQRASPASPAPPSPAPPPSSVEELKAAGNAAFKGGRFQEACELYGRALASVPGAAAGGSDGALARAALLSNRCFAQAKLGRHTDAVDDATAALAALAVSEPQVAAMAAETDPAVLAGASLPAGRRAPQLPSLPQEPAQLACKALYRRGTARAALAAAAAPGDGAAAPLSLLQAAAVDVAASLWLEPSNERARNELRALKGQARAAAASAAAADAASPTSVPSAAVPNGTSAVSAAANVTTSAVASIASSKVTSPPAATPSTTSPAPAAESTSTPPLSAAVSSASVSVSSPHTTTSPPPAAAAAAAAPSGPPKTAYELERTCGALKRHPGALAAYLRAHVPGSLLGPLFVRPAEPDLVAVLLRAVAAGCSAGGGDAAAEAAYAAWAAGFLAALASTRGFDTTAMLFGDAEAADAAAVLAWLGAHAQHVPGGDGVVSKLRAAFCA